MIKTQKVYFTEHIKRTLTIESFRFQSEEKFDFIPGQFLQILFDPDNLQNHVLNKYLSFSSSPTHNYIEITKRLSQSPFSQKLKTLQPTDGIVVRASFGQCFFNEAYKKILFLIGGIGITPVMSILEYVIEKKISSDIALFYSNRTEDDIAFKNELDIWQNRYKNIQVFYMITDNIPNDPKYIKGCITAELLREKISDFNERKIFIYGPPKMVEAMNKMVLDLGCANRNIFFENFVGY